MEVPVLACLAVMGLWSSLRADDYEDPANATIPGDTVSAFGGLEVQPADVGGSLVDVKEAIEPQMTALLVTSDVNASPGMTVVVQTSPLFDNWVSLKGGQ
jgi:hypothetical protein